ncbi:MAG: site-specific DNA-methyltransferase [Deltaproteobacteria bacterium]|nr:site-specific DNA-methyltransferase [Deltaproteobacteria bacterium]
MLSTAKPLYRTKLGAAYVGDSCELLGELPNNSIDLVVTSPPFALRRQKTYGNVPETEYVDWLMPFCRQVHRVLNDTGSFVLDLGGAYCAGTPARSLYNFRVLVALCDEVGFFLAEDFYWFNPAKLPSPIEWVNKRKIRAKDSVDTVWWFSKTPEPKADVRKVLTPYSERMKKLLADPDNYYQPDKRPSGHDIGKGFAKDNGGAIPSNLLSIPNTDSNSFYLRMCKHFDLERHPARFPEELPAFFIKMLTDPGDLVIDIFCGSNTSGVASERLLRRWLSLDISHEYLRASVIRFLEGNSEADMKDILDSLKQPTADLFLPTVVLSQVPNTAAERSSIKGTLPLFDV